MARNEGAGKDRVRAGTDGRPAASGWATRRPGAGRAARHPAPPAARLNLKSDLSASQLAPAPAPLTPRVRLSALSVCGLWLEPELEMELEVVGRSAVGAGSRAVLVLVLWLVLLPRLPCCEGALRPTFCVQYRGQI